jgi:hypothetical protein
LVAHRIEFIGGDNACFAADRFKILFSHVTG